MSAVNRLIALIEDGSNRSRFADCHVVDVVHVFGMFVGGKLPKPEPDRRHNAFPAVSFSFRNRFIRAAYNRQAAKVEAKVIKGGENAFGSVGWHESNLTVFLVSLQAPLDHVGKFTAMKRTPGLRFSVVRRRSPRRLLAFR